MDKRISYYVVSASPEDNQKGRFAYDRFEKREEAERYAKKLRENYPDIHIALEKHREKKRPNENRFGWMVDWDLGDSAIEYIDNY